MISSSFCTFFFLLNCRGRERKKKERWEITNHRIKSSAYLETENWHVKCVSFIYARHKRRFLLHHTFHHFASIHFFSLFSHIQHFDKNSLCHFKSIPRWCNFVVVFLFYIYTSFLWRLKFHKKNSSFFLVHCLWFLPNIVDRFRLNCECITV